MLACEQSNTGQYGPRLRGSRGLLISPDSFLNGEYLTQAPAKRPKRYRSWMLVCMAPWIPPLHHPRLRPRLRSSLSRSGRAKFYDPFPVFIYIAVFGQACLRGSLCLPDAVVGSIEIVKSKMVCARSLSMLSDDIGGFDICF